MPSLRDRSRFLLTIAAVTVSVLLFACGQDRRPVESADVPVRPRVSEASVAPPAPQTLTPAAPQTAIPAATAPAVPPDHAVPAPPPAAEPVPQEEQRMPPVKAGGTHVYSNKDLARYTRVKEEFGLGRDTTTYDLTAKTPAAPAPATEGMTTEQREEEIRETMRKINELNAESAYLKSRIPSLHNPYLARVKPSEADGVAEAGMDNAQRLARVNERLSQVDTQLNQLQLRLAELHQAEPKQETP